MRNYAIEVKPMKTGEPCPCCGQPIRTTDPITLYVLGWFKATGAPPPISKEDLRALAALAETEEA